VSVAGFKGSTFKGSEVSQKQNKTDEISKDRREQPAFGEEFD